MKNTVLITGQSVKVSDGKPIGKPQKHKIDLSTNAIFKDCKTLLEVKDAYESFWNHLPTATDEMVLVQKIRWK